jgi:hypothetical protein
VLVLEKVVDYGEPAHPALPALFEPAFLELVSQHAPGVDPDRAGFERERGPKRAIDIARPDAGAQPILAIVASAIASASSSKRCTVSTGPNTSFCAISSFESLISSRVGQ